MKVLAVFVALALAAVVAFAQDARHESAEPPPPPALRLDAPPELARPLADSLAGDGISVFLLPDAPPAGAYAARVVLQLPAVTRVRSSASDSPATETLCVQRAALTLLDPAGVTVFSGIVSAPGPDPSVLVDPLSGRLSGELGGGVW